MLKSHAALMIGKIKETVNKMIVFKLENHSLKGIVPSHGDTLVCLYQKNKLSVKEIALDIQRKWRTTGADIS